ncbi:MAG: hypothetical protein IT249_01135 [Chitinophagaceae bacterium]|nr:hypothetical protein [Chitinophagaceae bacterium]
MVTTTDIDQFTEECNAWREALRSQREEFNRMGNELQEASSHITSKESLKAVEHYQNQFDIQLSNIHNVKQSIKMYARMCALRKADDEIMLSEHDRIASDYYDLQRTLQSLKHDFRQFLISYS